MGFDPGAFSNSLLRGLSVGQGLAMNAENVKRQKQLDIERAEDRRYNRDRQAVIDNRAEQQFGWQQQQHDMLVRRYAEEEETKQMYKDLVFMESSIENGTYDTPEFFASFNRAFSDMVNVGGPEGSNKELVGATIAPGGAGFIPHIKVTTADGQSYQAPATLPNRDHTDKDLMVIPFKQFFGEMGSRKQRIQDLLQAKLAQLDPKGYLDNKRAVAAEQRKYQREDAVSDRDYRRELEKEKTRRDFELAKQGREYSLRRGLEAAKARMPGGSASGKTDLIQLRTGRNATLDDLRKSYIATYGKADPMGNLIGTVAGAPNYEAWVNAQATVPVFSVQEQTGIDTGSELYAKAEKMAKRWVDSQAGWASTDGSDFKQYGGNRQQALTEKTAEFYQMLKGENGQKPAGGAHPAAGGAGYVQSPTQGRRQNPKQANKSRKLNQAFKEYPILKGVNLAYVETPAQGKGVLEFWPPGEGGTKDYPRPAEIPMNQSGVQIFDKNATPRDIAADVVSHSLVHSDPRLKDDYQKFVKTFNTSSGQARLKEDYLWAKQNEGETRPFEQWATSTRIPAYFRGYVFQQWPQHFTEKVFTPEQKKILNAMSHNIQNIGDKQKPSRNPAGGQKPKKLDVANPEHIQLAKDLLKEARGDKAKARRLAQQRGYSF